MIELEIPGSKKLRLEHLMLDFNGTLAIDGSVLDGVQQRIDALARQLKVVVVTGDSHHNSRAQLEGFDCRVHVIGPEGQGRQKLAYLLALGADATVCIGNGMNDREALRAAALGVVVCMREGAAAAALTSADIVCLDILDALDLLLHPFRIVTTLRG